MDEERERRRGDQRIPDLCSSGLLHKAEWTVPRRQVSDATGQGAGVRTVGRWDTPGRREQTINSVPALGSSARWNALRVVPHSDN